MSTLGRMAALALIGVLVACGLCLMRPTAGPMVGKQAQEITGPDAAGEVFALSDYRVKVVLRDFWWSGIPPCRARFPHGRSLVGQYRHRPFVLLGVNA